MFDTCSKCSYQYFFIEGRGGQSTRNNPRISFGFEKYNWMSPEQQSSSIDCWRYAAKPYFKPL